MTLYVFGSLAVVHGDGGECAQAIGTYLAALAKKTGGVIALRVTGRSIAENTDRAIDDQRLDSRALGELRARHQLTAAAMAANQAK
jgi:hypothetical protein